MNNISLKRIIAGITSIIIPCICFSLNFTNSEIVNATSLDNDYLHEEVLGVPVYNETSLRDYISRYDNRNAIGNDIAPMDNDYGSSCDLSESIYFPPIGSQLGGSCTSWATTYYQFTYEANKLNNINTKEHNELAYSPVWTYNFLSGGEYNGAYIYEAYDLLREHGALKLTDCGLNAP